MKKIVAGLAMMAIVLGVAVSSAHAEESVYQNEDAGEAHCKADEAKFCPFAVKDKGHRIQCLKVRQSELSKECAKWVDRHHEVYKARSKACAEDKKKYCANIHEYGEVVKCFQANKAKLAGDCVATFSK